MSDRFFLDTNIFVYCFDRGAAQKSARAKRLIREAIHTQKGVVSYQVIQEFFNVALKRFAVPMRESEAEQYLGTVFRPILAVHSSAALFSEALRIHSQSKLSWFDSLIIGAAVQAGCDILFTEDLQHGRRFGGLRIENPFL